MDILEQIIAHKQLELPAIRAAVAPFVSGGFPLGAKPSLRQALLNSPTGIIAEFKRKSPSLGWINEDAKASDIPFSYQQNGAAALSILTDNRYFGGDDEFVKEARMSGVRIPVLYKNFVIDEHQLLQARLCGASTVLLIAACLDFYECKRLLLMAHSLGLEVLLEMHSEEELVYAELEPDLYGINNRHLGSFQTDVETSFRLVDQMPENSVKVSESGISNPATVRALREAGFEGFLIGEAFMKTDNPGKALAEFISKI
jgi:indole-3-glycerol phosphate synthase